MSEACRKYGIAMDAVRYRINNGMSIDEAFTTGVKAKTKSIIVGGSRFNSIKDACGYYNKDYTRVKKRFEMGWSADEAFDLVERVCIVDRSKNSKSIEVEGVKYPSIADACNQYNLSVHKVGRRLRSGWSVEEAFELINSRSICIEGNVFKSLKEASIFYKIPYGAVKERSRSKWSLEEIFELVPRCENGVISIRNWKIESLKITKYLGNDYYKCIEDNKIRYYSKEELFDIWSKFKEMGCW